MINKLILAIRSIKNLHVLFWDHLGFIKRDVLYLLWNGNKFIARGGTTDHSEIIINNADSEYPSGFYPTNFNPIILDIGANIGETALFIYRKLFKNKPLIYTIEPNKSNYRYLVRNIKLNNSSHYIFPFKIAITGRTGIGHLKYEGDKFDGGFIDNTRNKTWSKSEKVKTVSLVDFCSRNKIKNIDLLKMDIEGSEYEIFESSMPFIKKHVKSIFVELHNIDSKHNFDTFKKEIIKSGFSIEVEVMNRTLFLKNNNFVNTK